MPTAKIHAPNRYPFLMHNFLDQSAKEVPTILKDQEFHETTYGGWYSERGAQLQKKKLYWCIRSIREYPLWRTYGFCQGHSFRISVIPVPVMRVWALKVRISPKISPHERLEAIDRMLMEA